MIFLCPFTMCGCLYPYAGYSGKYPYTYTEACYSLPFSSGRQVAISEQVDPVIDLIEEDRYGRKLFCYYEDQACNVYNSDNSWEGRYILSLLICQKSDDENVYYYPDCNYYSVHIPYTGYFYTENFPEPLSYFKEEEIESFKEQNDWDKEFHEEKCIKQKLITDKESDEIDQTSKDEIQKGIMKTDGIDPFDFHEFASCVNLCSDEFGRKIYCFEFRGRNRGYYYCIGVFNPDMTFDKDTFARQIYPPFNCQKDIKELKELNHWSEALITA